MHTWRLKNPGLIAAFFLLSVAGAANAYMMYYVGNSHTDNLGYDEFQRMVQSTGKQMSWGRHMIPGAPLSWLWEHPDALCEQPYGCYRQALPNYHWDFVTLQCHSRSLEGSADSDVPMASNFINEARKGNSDAITYIYTNWVTKDIGTFAHWEGTYGVGSNSWCTGDYYKKLVTRLRERYAGSKPGNIRLAPNGFVLYELYRRIGDGRFTGLSSIYSTFADEGHLNKTGEFIIGTILYAVFFKQSPVGISSQSYGVEPSLARRLQELVWEVVNSGELAPLTGLSGNVSVPAVAHRRTAPEPQHTSAICDLRGRQIRQAGHGVCCNASAGIVIGYGIGMAQRRFTAH